MKLSILGSSLSVALAKDARFAVGVARKRPFSCLVQITNRCNLTCSFCDFWPNPALKSEELSIAEIRRISGELAELGTFVVSIEGGEPFTRSDLALVVSAFAEHHIAALFTSGWFVTKENATALWDAGLTHASVSIDYPDAARHDDKRGQPGTFERAWRAVDVLRDSAPRGGKQVNVMTVLMDSNWRDLEALFELSRAHEVGHQLTLLSTHGTRRGQSDDALPPLGVSAHLLALWEKFPHFRLFRDYLERIDAFVEGGPLPTCTAGTQALNIDHVGNVSSCIERIGKPVGNVREASLAELFRRLVAERPEIERCQACWTACRGFQQAMANGGALREWVDVTRRTSTY